VAFAWQRVAREVRFTHPELYESLSKKVLDSLGEDVQVDTSTEFKQLRDSIAQHEKEREQTQKQLEKIQREYYELAGALASAVPELKDYGDILAVALARIKTLLRQREAAQIPSPDALGNAQAAAKERLSPVPSAELLQDVIAGRTVFNKEQREWSVSEAMVLSGFQYTPVELLEKGDGFIAGILRDKQKT
jgi:phage tail tape-measure protein